MAMAEEESPQLFLCPISMELMEDPVTVSTGVTYDRRSIERWFFKYGKTTCPATMQRVASLDLTPNHTLKSVISSWQDRASTSTTSSSGPADDAMKPMARERLPSVLAGIEGTPFKVTALKRLKSCMAADEAARDDFVACDGIQVLGRVMAQALAESGAGGDFSAFRTCEEAAAVLATLPLSDEESVDLLLKPECMRSMVALVQRGSAEARLHAMSILAKVSEASGGRNWTEDVDVDDMVKSLLDLLSDGASSKLSSRALDVLIDVTARSRTSSRSARRGGKAVVEVGAVRVLVELLPDADRHVAERALLLLKRLCKCPEGRLAFAEHGLAVAAVVRTALRVSGLATRLAVNVLWLVSCAARPAERVLDDMVASGGVAKLLALLQAEGSPSTKEKAARMLRVHGAFWRQYPCIPADLKDYLKFLD